MVSDQPNGGNENMEKMITIQELTVKLEQVTGINLASCKTLGEKFRRLEMDTIQMFEGNQGYSDYAFCRDGDSSLVIRCNEQSARRLIERIIAMNRINDLEMVVQEDLIHENLYDKITDQNMFYLADLVDLRQEMDWLASISKETASTILVTLEDASNDDFRFEAKIQNGIAVVSEATFTIKTTDVSEFLYSAMRFFAHFQNSDEDQLRTLGFFLTIDGERELPIRDKSTGRDIILAYREGRFNDLFDDPHKTLELVLKFPIVMTVAPKRIWKDKPTVLAFLKANQAIVNKENRAFEESESNLNVVVATSIIRHAHNDDHNNAVFDSFPKALSEWLMDTEVLQAIYSSDMAGNIVISPKHFDEGYFANQLIAHPGLIVSLFEYWCDTILDYPKIVEHVKRKYGVRDDIVVEILAGLKCFEMMDILDHLDVCLAYLASVQDATLFLHEIIQRLSRSQIMKLARRDISFIQYIKNELDPNDPFVDHVICVCPEPGAFLSDETILTRNIKVYEDNKLELCRRCMECELAHIRIR
jgi:hypothetical protein